MAAALLLLLAEDALPLASEMVAGAAAEMAAEVAAEVAAVAVAARVDGRMVVRRLGEGAV